MALITVPEIYLPQYEKIPTGGFETDANLRIQNSSIRVGLNWIIPESLDGLLIDTINVHMGAVTTGNELRVGIYTVDGDGNPTSVGYDGGGDNFGVSGIPSANSTLTIPLSRNVTLTGGDVCAIVFESNDLDIVDQYIYRSTTLGRWPTLKRFDGATWSASANRPSIGIETTSGVVLDCLGTSLVTSNQYSQTFNLNSTPDERALKMTIPFGCRVSGIWFHSFLQGTFELVLYHGATSVSTGIINGNIASGSAASTAVFYLGTPTVLPKDTELRIAVKPTTGTNVNMRAIDYAAQKWMQAAGLVPGSQLSTRTDGGAWSDADTTTLPLMGLVIDQIDDGASGGGGTFPTEQQVINGVIYGPTDNLTGNVVLPAAADVNVGVEYGANGNEFTGTLDYGSGGIARLIGNGLLG